MQTSIKLHVGQLAMASSRRRTTLVTAGQGGGKTSGAYEWIHGLIDEFPGESGLIGFPDFGLLNRVVLDKPDPRRPTLVQFLESIGQEPKLHTIAKYIECKSTRIFFVSGSAMVGWEGSHAKWAWVDEFDECSRDAYVRAIERTNQAQGYVLLTGTPRHVRWCKEAIIQHIGKERTHVGDGIYVAASDDILWLQFPSTANPTYDPASLETMRLLMPAWEFDRIYKGELTTATGGNAFRREWWRRYASLPELVQRIQVWDTAFKAKSSNDYSVCATWGKGVDGALYLLDVYRKKMEWPDLVKAAKELYQTWGPTSVRIEDKASGQSLIQELRTKQIPVVAVSADMDKWRRAASVTGLVEAGYVFLPEYAPWVGDFIEEHAQFSPDDKHDYDDQVDTTSMALAYFKAGILTNGRPMVIGESKTSLWAPGRSAPSIESAATGSRIISGKGRSKWR